MAAALADGVSVIIGSASSMLPTTKVADSRILQLAHVRYGDRKKNAVGVNAPLPRRR